MAARGLGSYAALEPFTYRPKSMCSTLYGLLDRRWNPSVSKPEGTLLEPGDTRRVRWEAGRKWVRGCTEKPLSTGHIWGVGVWGERGEGVPGRRWRHVGAVLFYPWSVDFFFKYIG